MLCKVIDDVEDLLKCVALAEDHYNEVEKPYSGLPYSPKYDLFVELFSRGMIESVACYDEEELVGYVVFSITDSLLNDSLQAKEVGMYVKPNYRGLNLFNMMLTEAEAQLKLIGVDSVFITFKGEANKYKDYVINETTMYKRL